MGTTNTPKQCNSPNPNTRSDREWITQCESRVSDFNRKKHRLGMFNCWWSWQIFKRRYSALQFPSAADFMCCWLWLYCLLKYWSFDSQSAKMDEPMHTERRLSLLGDNITYSDDSDTNESMHTTVVLLEIKSKLCADKPMPMQPPRTCPFNDKNMDNWRLFKRRFSALQFLPVAEFHVLLTMITVDCKITSAIARLRLQKWCTCMYGRGSILLIGT